MTAIADVKMDKTSVFEFMLFIFDLIVNADQMEKAIASLQRLVLMFESMKSKEKQKNDLYWHFV
jgi:hypothetical protein